MCCFWKQKSAGVLTADGRTLNCQGYGKIKVDVGQVPAVDIEALVVDKQLLGFDLLLRIDAIKELGGVYLTESGKAHFGALNRCAAVSIDEPDLSVTYDRRNKEWKWANGHSPSELSNIEQELGGVYLTESGKAHFGALNRCAAVSIDEPDLSVTYDRRNKEWKWANGHSPSELSNIEQELGGVYLTESGKAHFGALNRCAAVSIDEPDLSVTYDRRNKEWKWANGHSPSELSNIEQEYAVPCHARDAYENEILQWQWNGWLLPYSEEELSPPKGLIPLMAVMQEQKQKVRPVLNYRELNGFVDVLTANAEVYAQKLREWRQQGVNVSLLNLQNAYLQIHVDKALWPFQTIIFRGQRFCLTQLGFELNVAPLIMKSVIDAIVSQDHMIKSATSALKGINLALQ